MRQESAHCSPVGKSPPRGGAALGLKKLKSRRFGTSRAITERHRGMAWGHLGEVLMPRFFVLILREPSGSDPRGQM